MDRGRDDPRGRGRGLLGSGGDLPARFDPAEFDALPDPSPAARARGDADAAQAFSMFSAIDTGIQRLLANFGMIRDLVADVRASVADNAARDAQRAEEEAARDEAIATRLIDPDALARHAEAGARQGAREAIASTVAELRRQIVADGAARELLTRQIANERVDRRDSEMRQRRRDGWWYGALAGFALLVPVALGYGYHLGDDAGTAASYARSRDEVAAVNWANTPNGKLARQLDQISQQTIPTVANCSGDGWIKTKQDGRHVCFGGGGAVTGWFRL